MKCWELKYASHFAFLYYGMRMNLAVAYKIFTKPQMSIIQTLEYK